MAEQVLLDVIVPVYNGAAYLPAFFDMVSRQADERVRLLFVDDGSTDGSGALLDGFAEDCAFPVKVIHQENVGVSAARNAGIEASDADYIAFFDVDDRAAPDYVAVLLRAAAEGCEIFVFPQRRVTEETAPALPVGPAVFRRRTAEEQLDDFLADPTRLGVYDVMLRRDFLERIGLRFPVGYPYYEDYDFLYRAFAQADELVCTDRALYDYVLRDGSAMSRFAPERLSCLTLMTDLEPWLDAKVPAFGGRFRRWGAARIYWSVLWQAALASPSFEDFRQFAARTHAGVYLRKLRDFPSRRVALSSRLFLRSKRAYYAAAKRLGGRRSRVGVLSAEALAAAAEACPDPRKILVYGMTDNPGGIETYLMALLRRSGPGRFDFLCDFPSIAYADEIAARGAAVYFIPAKSRSLWGHWRGAARVLRAHPEYTTVYLNVLDAGCAVLAVVPRLYGRRIVVHSHNGDTDKTRLHRLCRPLLSLLTDGRAACSDEAARHMFGKPCGEEVLFVPNAIDGRSYAFDPAVRAGTRAALGLEGKLVVCHVGRITRQKNPFGLLDIFAAVRDREPRAVLLSVGEGELAPTFDARVRALGLEDAVRRLGRRSDVPALLQAADVFLLPSLYEGLSIALLEAQAAGLPAVASDVLSPRTVISDAVRLVGLAESPVVWAEQVLAAAGTPRTDGYAALVRAGFDVSACGAVDARLTRLLLGE